MKRHLYWVGAALVLALGIYLATSISVILQSPMMTVVSFAQYETPEDFGRVIFTTLQPEVKNASVILLGVTPNQIEDMELWRGFLQAAAEAGPSFKYDVIAVEPMLPYVELFDSNLRFDIKNEMDGFVEGVKKAQAEGLRVAVIVPHIYSSQLLKRNPADRLKQDYKLPIHSLTVSKFPVTRQQEEFFEPPCIYEEGKDMAGTGALGCAIRQAAKKTYKEKFEDNKYSGLVEKISSDDILILFNRNQHSR